MTEPDYYDWFALKSAGVASNRLCNVMLRSQNRSGGVFSKDYVKQLAKTREALKFPGFGETHLLELCQFLGIEYTPKPDSKGTANKYIKWLEERGYTVIKPKEK